MDELYYVPFVQTCLLICSHVQFFFCVFWLADCTFIFREPLLYVFIFCVLTDKSCP